LLPVALLKLLLLCWLLLRLDCPLLWLDLRFWSAGGCRCLPMLLLLLLLVLLL
jgi:hypothetical protein